MAGKDPRIWLSPPHMGGEEQKYIKEAFDTNWIAPLGPNVDAFERECAELAGARAALALTSGTAAALLAGRLLDIEPGDVIFASSLTFVASIAPLVQMGAVPVFIDSEPTSWNMSPQALERAFEDAEASGRMPRAVILVDLYGQACDMDSLIPICERRGVPVIEDAAEAVGARYRGRMAGSFGKFAFWSFNGNKIITTSGGGMLMSDDEDAIARARSLSTQAREKAPWYEHKVLGYNFRMSNIVAGVGRAQIKLVPDRVAKRRAIYDRYAEAFADLDGAEMMPEPEWSTSNRWLSVMTIDRARGITPAEVIAALAEDDIESRHVWKPMHLQPVFEGARYFEHDGDVSRDLFERGVCLPSGSSMTERDLDRVIARVRGAFGK